MSKLPSQEKILNEYEKQSQEILTNMLNVLTRAQRKVDDRNYRFMLKKLLKDHE